LKTHFGGLQTTLAPQLLNFGTKTYLTAVRSLESFPNRCTIAPEAQEFQQTIRQLWIGKSRNYRVLFVVEANQVFIVHVRHSSKAFLKKDSEES
jgi:hypothetical protein